MVRIDITVVKGMPLRLRLNSISAPYSFIYSVNGSSGILTEGILTETHGVTLTSFLTASLPEGSGSYEIHSSDDTIVRLHGELRVVNSVAQSFQNSKMGMVDPRD
jgi:hypothetical protein